MYILKYILTGSFFLLLMYFTCFVVICYLAIMEKEIGILSTILYLDLANILIPPLKIYIVRVFALVVNSIRFQICPINSKINLHQPMYHCTKIHMCYSNYANKYFSNSLDLGQRFLV